MNGPINIILAEDQNLIREALAALLKKQYGDRLRIAAQTDNGLETVRKCLDLKPDILLLDLIMPGLSGTDVLHEIRQRVPETKVIVLTNADNADEIEKCVSAGVDGYVLKQMDQSELFRAINDVLQGKKYISVEATRKLNQKHANAPNGGAAPITSRERQVLKLIAEGNKNQEIAAQLFISVKTVEKHRSNLRQKLGINNTAGLTAYAIEEGFI